MTSPFMDEVYEAAVEAVGNAIEKLKEVWNDFVDGVNEVLKVIPGYLSPGLRYALKRLWPLVTEVIEKLWKVYTERGSASDVRQVASDWNSEAGKKSSDQANQLQLGQLPTSGTWSGPAASKYLHAVNTQNKALNDVKAITDSLMATLNEIADALKTFWSRLAMGVLAYLGLMIACAAGAATAVGAVESIIAAIGFSLAFIALLNELSNDFANALDSKEAKLESLATAPPGDNWPAPAGDAISSLALVPG